MIRGGYWGGAWGLSWAGAWGEAWLLLNQPYPDLDLEGQLFVRAYLTRLHSVEVVEQIVSAAVTHRLSAVDAAVAVTAKQSRLSVAAVTGRRGKPPAATPVRPKMPSRVSPQEQGFSSVQRIKAVAAAGNWPRHESVDRSFLLVVSSRASRLDCVSHSN